MAEVVMTREESHISGRITRRGFMGTTAGAALAALVGREPQVVRAAGRVASADAVIVLWMAGGMAQTETKTRTATALRTAWIIYGSACVRARSRI